jgi:hypothetical protein
MSVTLWLTVRQVRQALRGGHPDTARRLLDPFVQDGYRKAIALLPEVARGFRLRAEKALRRDDADAAWTDLLAAETLNAADPELAALRATLTKLGLAECRAALIAGNPSHVFTVLARLKQRTAFHPDFEWHEAAAREWVLATELADRGDFSAALATLDRGRARVPPDLHFGFDTYAGELARRQEQCAAAAADLHDAASAARWPDVLRAADRVTAVAPDHRDARNLKARAWEVLQAALPSGVGDRPTMSGAGRDAVELAWAVGGAATGGASAFASTRSYPLRADPLPPAADPPSPTSTSIKRFVLWIDGVGGYLVCLSQRVGFGQATANGPVDVPLFADVSRLHAELSRDAEGYVIESGRELMVNGQPTTRTPLSSGDRVTLGATCQFVFHQPVPISPSARLELVSGHRLPLAVDGVLLMAENLILGPAGPVHVVLPDAGGNVILYRGKDGLGIRFGGPFKIDNKPAKDRATLPVPCCVTADSFTFAIEAVPHRV